MQLGFARNSRQGPETMLLHSSFDSAVWQCGERVALTQDPILCFCDVHSFNTRAMKGRAAEVKEMLYVAVASVRQVLDDLAAFVNSTIVLSPMHTVAYS
jgi:hypothetical protein